MSPIRVFVSSSMQELAAERQAVKAALQQMIVDAWVFESDAGARPESIRQTYLDEVEGADLYLGIFWKRYGQYTIDEYRHARRSGKECLIYEKRTELDGRDSPLQRDPPLQAFLDEISRVESGLTIRRFQTPEELGEFVKEDVARWQERIIRQKKAAHAPLFTIPDPPADFTGRQSELDQLLARFEAAPGQGQDSPTVTLIAGLSGGAGVGKTALARLLARRLAERYPAARLEIDLHKEADRTFFQIMKQDAWCLSTRWLDDCFQFN